MYSVIFEFANIKKGFELAIPFFIYRINKKCITISLLPSDSEGGGGILFSLNITLLKSEQLFILLGIGASIRKFSQARHFYTSTGSVTTQRPWYSEIWGNLRSLSRSAFTINS